MVELPTLYPHQEALRDRTREALRKHQRVILTAPPGVGKTRIAKWILGAAGNREPSENQSGHVLFAVHRRGLVDNASNSFKEEPALRHGVIMSGVKPAYGARVQVASIDTLLSWFVEGGQYDTSITFDLIVFDECHSHHAKLAKFLEHHDAYRQDQGKHPAYVIGLSATPEAKGLADVYREIVLGPPTQWLIDNRFLSPFRYFRATEGRLGLLVKRGGEFTEESVSQAMAGLSGDLVRDWKRFAAGRPTVGFFPRRTHAQEAKSELEAAGLRVAYVDGETDDTSRARMFWELGNGKLDYLCNVQVVERGTDIPAIGCVQLCVAVGSVVRYRQMIGRGSRVHPEKQDCLVLDHGSNVKRLGFFEDDPLWTLDRSKSETGEVGVRTTIECPVCCVARGTMILTDRGEIPIQDVRITDRVWDGVEFCFHGGTCCNGIREAIEWGGLTLTPDHRVLTNAGWKEAEEAKGGRWRPVVGGIGGTPVRTVDDSNPYHPHERFVHRGRSRLLSLRETWLASLPQNLSTATSRMRALLGEVWPGLPRMARSEGQSGEVAVPMPATSCLQDVWRERDRVSLSVGARSGAMDCRQSWTAAKQIVDAGSHRQQRSLRTWKPALGDDADAGAKSRLCMEGEIPSEIPVRDILRDSDFQSSQEGADSETDRRPMVVEVWDVLDCGPRNRYCANGVIVSNCAIYRGGKCRSCGYEPTPKERRAQGLEFDGAELVEVKRKEKAEKKILDAETLMVMSLYKAGKSGRTWKQAVGMFLGMAKQQGTKYRVPKRVTVGGRTYRMLPYGHPDSGARVRILFPFTVERGNHSGAYLES